MMTKYYKNAIGIYKIEYLPDYNILYVLASQYAGNKTWYTIRKLFNSNQHITSQHFEEITKEDLFLEFL